jgi:hypothetical protein
MDETPQQDDPTGDGAPSGAPQTRPVPMAAIAGAIILVGLVAFALYRRGLTAPTTGQEPAASKAEVAAPGPAAVPGTEPAAAAAPGAAPAAGDAGTTPQGTAISVPVPTRLSPEASVLAERYRCVCGCNLTLSVCTCRNDKGSEDMKKALNVLVDQHKSPAEADQAMAAQFGPVALLSNPAPPATAPSHPAAAKPAPAPTKKSPPAPRPKPASN